MEEKAWQARRKAWTKNAWVNGIKWLALETTGYLLWLTYLVAAMGVPLEDLQFQGLTKDLSCCSLSSPQTSPCWVSSRPNAFPIGCSEPVAEWGRDAKTGPFLEAMELLCWLNLPQCGLTSLSDGLGATFLDSILFLTFPSLCVCVCKTFIIFWHSFQLSPATPSFSLPQVLALIESMHFLLRFSKFF